MMFQDDGWLSYKRGRYVRVADKMGIPHRTAYAFLDELADAGRIRKKKPEPRRAIWICADE